MNPYTLNFLGEVAAQHLGFEPSHVWGKLKDPGELRDHHDIYHAASVDKRFLNLKGIPAIDHIKEMGKEIHQNLPTDSVFKKDRIKIK